MVRTVALALLTGAAVLIFTIRVALPLTMGWSVVVIEGNSMEPSLPFGALAYVVPQSEYEVGDIVTYRSGDHLVTHRITTDVSGNADFWWTQGDNSSERDPNPIRPNQILGAVTSYIPAAGIGSRWLDNPFTIVFLGLLAGMLLWPGSGRGKDQRSPEPGHSGQVQPRNRAPMEQHPHLLIRDMPQDQQELSHAPRPDHVIDGPQIKRILVSPDRRREHRIDPANVFNHSRGQGADALKRDPQLAHCHTPIVPHVGTQDQPVSARRPV